MLTLTQRINDECEDDESEKYHVELLETREDAAESLQSTKQSLDFVAPLVHLAVVLPGFDPRSQRRHHWLIPQRQCQLPGLVDFRAPRGLDKDLVLSLADGRWVREHLSILIIGPAGIGKSWIACALAHSACRHGHSASYRRLPRLLTELAIARADGSYPKLLASLAKTEVLVIDDFGLAKLSAENRRDLLEITEDRYGIRSTVITSQLPVENWHDIVGDPTLADAILDRLVHSSYQLNLKGESMRKRRQPLTQTDHRDS